MRQKPGTPKPSADRIVRDIRRKTRKRHSTEEKIRIVLEGLRGDDSIAELCRREGSSQSLYYSWSHEVLEAGETRTPSIWKAPCQSSFPTMRIRSKPERRRRRNAREPRQKVDGRR